MPGKISITVGLPGSGKTTLAQGIREVAPLSTVLVSRDDLRKTLFNGEGVLTGHEESYVSKVQKSIVRDAVRADKHVVIHDLNLREKYRADWMKTAFRMGANFEIIDLTRVPLDFCLTRNTKRGLRGERSVPNEVIVDLYKRFVAPLSGSQVPYPSLPTNPVTFVPYEPTQGLREAILVDIDGTVADGVGVRNMYDTSKYHLDLPKREVIRIVQDEAYRLGTMIVFLSGRHQDFRDVTEEWLFEHVKVPFTLLMREDRERDDSVEKYLLFDKYVRGNWNIKYVLDDRDRVVNMWRSIGLLTLQVQEGDF